MEFPSAEVSPPKGGGEPAQYACQGADSDDEGTESHGKRHSGIAGGGDRADVSYEMDCSRGSYGNRGGIGGGGLDENELQA